MEYVVASEDKEAVIFNLGEGGSRRRIGLMPVSQAEWLK